MRRRTTYLGYVAALALVSVSALASLLWSGASATDTLQGAQTTITATLTVASTATSTVTHTSTHTSTPTVTASLVPPSETPTSTERPTTTASATARYVPTGAITRFVPTSTLPNVRPLTTCEVAMTSVAYYRARETEQPCLERYVFCDDCLWVPFATVNF